MNQALYFFVRRLGNNAEDARDLTQGYFLRLMERDYLDTVREEVLLVKGTGRLIIRWSQVRVLVGPPTASCCGRCLRCKGAGTRPAS